MTQQLKQSQTAEPLLFLMVQSADHITPLTGASPTVTLSKNGAAFGAPAGAVTEVANGWYKVAGNATDTGTLGLLVLHATATSGDPSDAIYQVVGGDPESASVVASSVTGSVGSVTGAVGSVTGNVGGNVVGSVASVTAAVSLSAADSPNQHSGTAQAGAASTITLAAGASATDQLYRGQTLKITSGTGAGQSRMIQNYVGSTKVVTVNRAWATNPDSTSVYAILATDVPKTDANLQVTAALQAVESLTLQSGTAQAGAASSITLAAAASATDSTYVGEQIKVYGGTGAGQVRIITAYVGSTKVATVDRAWATNPDSTSSYNILPLSGPALNSSLQDTAASVQGNVTGSVASVTGAVGSVTAAVTAGTVSDKTGYSLAADQPVNVTKVGGTTQTARDLGASVLISPGTGTGQLDVTSGVIKANLAQILGTALTETAGQIAAAFKKYFDIASPTSTMNTITAVTTAANLTTNNDKTGYALTAGEHSNVATDAQTGLTAQGYTAARGVKLDDLDATISSRSTYAGGAVASVTADVGITQAAADKVWGTTVRALTDKVGFALSAAGIQAIWDELTSLLTTVGSIGKWVVDKLDTTVSSRNAVAPDNADIATILTRTDVATSTRADSAHYTNARGDALDELLAANIPTDVDSLITGVNVIQWRGATPDVLSSGKLPADIKLWLATAPAALNNSLVQADVERWLNVIPAAYAAPDNADIVLIKAKTDNLPADPASNTEVDTRLATSGYTAPPSTAAIVTAILDGLLTGHSIADSVATALRSASSAGDPWATPIPGAYGAGTAGYIAGHNLDTNVGSRLATAGYTAPDNADITAIKAKTDNLPADPASNTEVDTRLATSGYTAPANSNITAIKAKTDNLPADPASNTEVDTRLAAGAYTVPPTAAAIDAEFTGVHGAGTWQQGNTVVPANAAILAAIAAIPAPATVDAIWRDAVVYPDGSKGAELALTAVGGDPLRTTVPGSYPIGSAGYNLGLLASGQVTVISPLSVDGKILYLIPGMAYQAERGTGLQWTLPVGAPDLSAAASHTIEIGYPRKPVLQSACTYSRDIDGVQHLALELTSAQTNTLPDAGGTCAFAIWARWSDYDTDAVPSVTGVCVLEKSLP